MCSSPDGKRRAAFNLLAAAILDSEAHARPAMRRSSAIFGTLRHPNLPVSRAAQCGGAAGDKCRRCKEVPKLGLISCGESLIYLCLCEVLDGNHA